MRRETFSSLMAAHSCWRLANSYLHRHPIDVLTHPCPACGHLLTPDTLGEHGMATCPNCRTQTHLPGHVVTAMELAILSAHPPLCRTLSPDNSAECTPPPSSDAGDAGWPIAIQILAPLLFLLFIAGFLLMLIHLSTPR